jgi:hypothetical protein
MASISSLTNYTSLAEQLSSISSSTKSSLVDYLNSSGDSLTETLMSVASDNYSISAISQSLSAISKAAKESDVDDSEVLNNVQAFAMDLQTKGYDTVSIMKYLSMVRDLAENDPEKFTEMFSTSEDSSTTETISTLSSDSTDETVSS